MELVVVSGGSNGLGLELVKKLLEKGYLVVSLDRQPSDFKNENLVEYIGDISDELFVKDAFEKIGLLGNLIAIFNNAGEPVFKKPVDYKADDINKCFKGLEGMILLSTESLKLTNESNLKIVNILSSAAIRGKAGESVYCATKWGERGYTESLKDAYKGTSIKVIAVYPGGINTDFYKNSRDYVSIDQQNKFMDPKHVAEVIVNNVFNDNLTVADIIIERN